MTLALRVVAAPDHAAGSVLPLPGFGVDERGVLAGKQLSLGETVDVGATRFTLVEALRVVDARYSSGQITIFDATAELAGEWTERHLAQGFIRGEGHLGLRTLPESGHVLVRVFSSPYVGLAEDARVIAVPFRVISGTVHLMAPDERTPHVLTLAPGEYRLVTCQRFFDGDQDLDLFFERVDLPRQRSEVLVADRELQPELPLLEGLLNS